MTEDTSPENLRKFLESDDPAMVLMGLSMSKGIGMVSEELLPTILRLYMWDDDKNVRAASKSAFNKYAPAEIRAKVKKNWKASYRTLVGDRFPEAVRPFLEAFKSQDDFVGIALEPLIGALGDDDLIIRSSAAEALGKIGDVRAVEPLIKALGGTVSAARALGEIGDERAVEPLIDVAGNVDLDHTWEGITQAAYALGKIGDARAVDPLIEALDTGLGYVEGSKDDIQSDRLWEARGAFVEVLGEIGDARSVEPLIKALEDEQRRIREGAVEALRKIGEVAVEPLINGLANSGVDADILVHILERWALGKIGDTRAVEPLIEALGDDEWYVRWYAAMALGEIGDTRAVEPLIEALGDEDWRVRKSAALGGIGDPRAVGPLIELLGDEFGGVRRSAIGALGDIGDKRAVEPLIKALSDEDGDVRKSAIGALGKIGDERAVEPLIGVLSDEDDLVRRSAIEALGEMDDARAVKPLIELLGHSAGGSNHVTYINDPIGWCTAGALGEIGDARAVEPLINALGDGIWEAAEALGKIGDARAIEPLIKAIETIQDLDCSHYGETIDVEYEFYISSLKHAVWALGEIGDMRAVEPLIEALDSDWESAEEALRKLGAAGIPFPDYFSLNDL